MSLRSATCRFTDRTAMIEAALVAITDDIVDELAAAEVLGDGTAALAMGCEVGGSPHRDA